MGWWLLGFAFSLGGGYLGAELALRWLRRHTGLAKEDRDPETRAVPPWLLGLAERFFFTIVVAGMGTAAAPSMIGWLAVKMAANWNRPIGSEPKEQTRRARGAVMALVAGMVSMTFALLGGLIIRGWRVQ